MAHQKPVLPPLGLGHPLVRPRRLRQSATLRAMVQETRLKKSDIIVPLFVHNHSAEFESIGSLPGIHRIPLSALGEYCHKLAEKGCHGILLFSVNPASTKTSGGSEAWNPDGILQRAVQRVKRAVPGLVVFADVALDPFTTHGHDGVVNEDTLEVLNDETVNALCHMSLSLAQAGVDFVAPSDMMDGRTQAIRTHLDSHGYQKVGILAYSAKFASSFYGPFREAVQSGPANLDKKTYQIEAGNVRQAILEAVLDAEEGADMIMVKPATCYLDVISQIRPKIHVPLVAYHVSGEYCMVKAAASNGWLDEKTVALESLLGVKRAGADLIVTYFAEQLLDWLDY